MLDHGLCPLEFRPRRTKGLPAEGQQVRVLVSKAIELWQGSRRVRYAEGEAFVGTVTAVGTDGLLDMEMLDGRAMRLHARDVAFMIEPYEC